MRSAIVVTLIHLELAFRENARIKNNYQLILTSTEVVSVVAFTADSVWFLYQDGCNARSRSCHDRLQA